MQVNGKAYQALQEDLAVICLAIGAGGVSQDSMDYVFDGVKTEDMEPRQPTTASYWTLETTGKRQTASGVSWPSREEPKIDWVGSRSPSRPQQWPQQWRCALLLS